MKNIRIKETYLLFLIVIGLVSLAVYTTYALFTTSTEIEDVVEFTTTLSTNNSIIEYEMVTVPAGDTKIVELNITNSYNQTLYYGAWYEMISPSTKTADIELGLYTDKNNTASSGTITSGTTKKLLVGITNNASSSIMLNIGTIGSATSNLGLASTRTLLPTGWSEALIVTDDVLEEYATTTTKTINNSYSYTGAVQNVTLNPGTYKLEVWGAQGGSYNTTYAGGKGGYSYGTLTLTSKTDMFVYVGGQGTGSGTSTTGARTGGFNGGGKGYSSSTTYLSSAGGGASDIRIGQDSLYARVIVAGGGGGAGSYNASNRYAGGAGGGTSGSTGSQYSTSYKAGTGGSATSVGISYYGQTQNSTSYGTPASFGTGGAAGTSSGVAGGGGGWYGGGYARRASGGGGSGYVYTSSTASNYPSGCLLNSSYYLTSAATVAGNTSFTDYSGSAATGHSGNGNAKITGTEQIKVYTIPRLTGLTNLTISLGKSYNLTSDVTLTCEHGGTGCAIVSTSITDTSVLAEGDYVVKYVVKDSSNKKYIYSRNITITSLSGAQLTLASLGLTGLINGGTPTFTSNATTDEGIYAADDDLGTSYYFRGASTKNYVKFGKYQKDLYSVWNYNSSEDSYTFSRNSTTCTSSSTIFCNKIASTSDDMYWRIIRINGDGTIRLLYDGTTPYTNAKNDSVSTFWERYKWFAGSSSFNSAYNDNAHMGYMFGTVGATTYDATHANNNESVIKQWVEDWYEYNLTGYTSYIADAIYCNDRSISKTGSLSYRGDGYGTKNSTYGAGTRLTASPILTCPQANDRFTKSTTLGNGKLAYPVGLITADELVFAGAIDSYSNPNTSFYGYFGTNMSYYTMTPDYFNGSAGVISFQGRGYLSVGGVMLGAFGVKPVISLKMDVLNSGTGTINDPFKMT